MVAKQYVPNRGDVVWLTFNPTRGHEQKGRRPALVISPFIYNAKSGLTLVCPITSQVKNYPFEVNMKIKGVEGVGLVDQIRSVDWGARDAKRIGSVSEATMRQVQELLQKLILS